MENPRSSLRSRIQQRAARKESTICTLNDISFTGVSEERRSPARADAYRFVGGSDAP